MSQPNRLLKKSNSSAELSRSGAHFSISTSPTYDVLYNGINTATLELFPQLTFTTMYDSPIGHLLRRSYERNSTIQFHIANLRFIVIIRNDT